MQATTAAALRGPVPGALSVYGLVGLWLAAVAVGWWSIQEYQFAVNAPLQQPPVDRWPAVSGLSLATDRATLVLFLHPKCPCSRATVSELERLFASAGGRWSSEPNFWIVATVPEAADDEWYATGTVERAGRLPRARLFVDAGGIEAARFGATTSGLLMLFDPVGRRQYVGGITTARGHEGASVGSKLLAAVLRGERGAAEGIPAFGCRLCLPESDEGVDFGDRHARFAPPSMTAN